MTSPAKLPRTVLVQASRVLGLLGSIEPASGLDLNLLRRVLLHAALVGVASGLVGAFFFASVEWLQWLLLELAAGFRPLHAHGEALVHAHPSTPFRPWLLALIPAVGGLLAGLAMRLAPEARGGGGNAFIATFHHHGGVMRRRVAPVKLFASICTLGFGGAGGREGPTMQIGGALGSLISGVLGTSARERRILLLAGAAAGISAVFRTPLGAAILVVEVLYREGFEGDALIPAVLASVVSYSVVISIFGESTLFAHAPRYPFFPRHLPLYGAMAVIVALFASLFVRALETSRKAFRRVPVARWVRPALGGLALGVLAAPLIMVMGERIGQSGQGLGVLGGGYGAAQIAITGSQYLGEGWRAVELLFILALVKLVAASLTIGSGGSAGDFAPSITMGGLLGGAFGRAASLLLGDPSIDPGAFALVGMGAFFGGIAHVPLASLVLVCEMAGSYDLLVPLMLAEAIAFVLLRKRSLYEAQVPTMRDSPVHQGRAIKDLLTKFTVDELMAKGRAYVEFNPQTPAQEMLHLAGQADPHQDIFPVIDRGALKGLVTSEALRTLAGEPELQKWSVAADLMQRSISVHPEDDAAAAAKAMLQAELRELPVVDKEGAIVGFIDEADVARVYLQGEIPGRKRGTSSPDDTWIPGGPNPWAPAEDAATDDTNFPKGRK
jgi:chloride channel protein, CIC family